MKTLQAISILIVSNLFHLRLNVRQQPSLQIHRTLFDAPHVEKLGSHSDYLTRVIV